MAEKKFAGVKKVLQESKAILPEKLRDAIDGVDNTAYLSCTIKCGHITLDDGRQAQITMKIETDEDDWIGEDYDHETIMQM